MRATSSAFSESSSKPGEAAAARSTKSETDSYSSSSTSGSGRSGLGMSSDGTRKTTSPATRSGSRLVARIVSWGAKRSSRSDRAAVAARTCSQLSSTSSSVRVERTSITASTTSCAGRARISSAAAIASGISRASASAASSTSAAPASYDDSALRASSSASRVFPDAAGPRQREEARASKERRQFRQLLRAADERARVGREPERPRGTERGGLLLELGGQRRELLATRFRPVVVAVFGQELAGIERDRCAVRARCLEAASVCGCELEPVDVDVCREREDLVSQFDRLGIERAPRDMHRLVQVVRGRRRAEVSPEDVHRLLSVQSVSRREREQLHELARFLQPPGGRGNRNTVHLG